MTTKLTYSTSDHQLILLWQSGDDTAFEHLYRKYAVRLLRIATHKTGDIDAAKELVQETFITFLQNRKTADKLSSVLAYLYVILKNKIVDRHRHNLVHQNYQNYAIRLFSKDTVENNILVQLETQELEQQLSDEIQKLPSRCGLVFRLKREQDLSNKEVAAVLSISENTVEQHMRKALRLLKIAFQIEPKL